MMRIKTREKVTALLMAALVSLGAATESFAFTPWSNINGKWISADGKTVIEDAVEKGITSVVFDRGGFLYHGKVKALADAAREAGLEF